MNEISPLVDLLEFQGLGLIVKWASGVRYTNQTAGLACAHPEIEGVFVPLFDGVGHPVLHAIRNHFRGNWHPLNSSDADILDRILCKHGLGFIRVDRADLSASYEAWVHIQVSDDITFKYAPRITGFSRSRGILTWPNSD